MAKKKKDKEVEYSKYQKDIFDYIEHGQGHLVVEAAARECRMQDFTWVRYDDGIEEREGNVSSS